LADLGVDHLSGLRYQNIDDHVSTESSGSRICGR
jgi:hypothetical protein